MIPRKCLDGSKSCSICINERRGVEESSEMPFEEPLERLNVDPCLINRRGDMAPTGRKEEELEDLSDVGQRGKHDPAGEASGLLTEAWASVNWDLSACKLVRGCSLGVKVVES